MKIGDKKTIKLSPEEAYGLSEVVIPKADLQSFVDAGIELVA
jgi:FKBP-type peptidyl-prolyl cis-trans isomerase 2